MVVERKFLNATVCRGKHQRDETACGVLKYGLWYARMRLSDMIPMRLNRDLNQEEA
jgi:hypothetical protein